MEIMLIIGIPFSALLVIVGSCIYLGGKFKQELMTRIGVALVCFIFCLIDLFLLELEPIEIQAKKYTIALSMALTVYVGALIFNLIRARIVYDDMKGAKSECEASLRLEREDRGGGENDNL